MNKTTILSLCLSIGIPLCSRSEEHPASSLRAPESAAQPHVPTTVAQRQQIITITHSLEKAAFKLGATTDREAALWMIDHAPDIFPRLQGPITSDISKSGIPDWRPIYAQFIFGFVCFQLEHPERADNAVAVYHAALTSCLQVYRQTVIRDSTNRLAFLDAADEAEQNGTLQKYTEQIVAALPDRHGK